MLKDQKISLVIPCLNEAQALPGLLERIPEGITEVMVVDNGSTDGSADVARKYSATVITEDVKGYGSALLRGIAHAQGDIIALLDADGTYSIQDLTDLLILMETDHLDLISGCRFPLVDPAAMPLANTLANHFISWFISVQFRINIKDSQSGLIIFKRNLLDKITIKNKGMGFSQEIKIKAWLQPDVRCTEKHIHYKVRIGKSNFNGIKDALKNLFALITVHKGLRLGRGNNW